MIKIDLGVTIKDGKEITDPNDWPSIVTGPDGLKITLNNVEWIKQGGKWVKAQQVDETQIRAGTWTPSDTKPEGYLTSGDGGSGTITITVNDDSGKPEFQFLPQFRPKPFVDAPTSDGKTVRIHADGSVDTGGLPG